MDCSLVDSKIAAVWIDRDCEDGFAARRRFLEGALEVHQLRVVEKMIEIGPW